MYMLDAGASADKLLGGSQIWLLGVESQPPNERTVHDLYISLFRRKCHSSGSIARNLWPDRRGHRFRRYGVVFV